MAKEETIRVRVTRNVLVGGEHVEQGSVIDVSKRDGRYLIAMKKAEEVDAGTKLVRVQPKETATVSPHEMAVGAGQQIKALEARIAELEKQIKEKK